DNQVTRISVRDEDSLQWRLSRRRVGERRLHGDRHRFGEVSRMKAAAFSRQNEMAVIDAPEPTAEAGQVVLQVHDCGICGSDLHACQYGMGMPAGSKIGRA